MFKRLLIGGGIAGVLTAGILIGSLTLGPVFAKTGSNDTGQYKITNDMSEADEAAALQAQASISATDAEQAALAANQGTDVVKTELDNENGMVVYSVELSNGLDVKVDAGDGTIVSTDQAGDESELDDVAEAESEGQELDNIDNQVEQDGEFEGEF